MIIYFLPNHSALVFYLQHKKGLLNPEHLPVMIKQMTTLNKIGKELGKIKGVTAMTDVTGFGLLGHLIEMAEEVASAQKFITIRYR